MIAIVNLVIVDYGIIDNQLFFNIRSRCIHVAKEWQA